MAGWIPPTLIYILVLGAAGVTAKLALRTITWEQMVLWLPIAYVLAGGVPGAIVPLVELATPYRFTADELGAAVEALETWLAGPTW